MKSWFEYCDEEHFSQGEAKFAYMGLRQDKLTSIPGLSKLKSLYFGHGILDWAIIALPHLRTLELGDSAKVELPADESSAPNITSLVIGNSCVKLGPPKLRDTVELLRRLPNLGSLELKSILKHSSRHPSWKFYGDNIMHFDNFRSSLGLFSATEIAALITGTPSTKTLSLTYGSQAKFSRKASASPLSAVGSLLATV